MTAIVGVLCKDGIVVGADGCATAAMGTQYTTKQPTQKIFIVGESVILAGTGAVGLGQRFHNIVKTFWSQKQFKVDSVEVAKGLTNTYLKDLHFTFAKDNNFGALLAFPVERKAHLCEFEFGSFQPEFKTPGLWYASMGSGQGITDPFLGFIRDVFWTDGPPSLHDGVFAVRWTLDHVVAVNPGGIDDPIQIAVLEKKKDDWRARQLEDAELEEHKQNITAAKEHLREFRNEQRSTERARDVPKATPIIEADGNIVGR